MDNKMIMLNSITYAYKARDILQKNNITAYVKRVPAHLRKTGCGYGVSVKDHIDEAISILNKDNIQIKDVIDL